MSNPQPLGVIQPTPGTPAKITINFTRFDSGPGRPGLQVSGLFFQVLPGNTGDVYIGDQTLNRGTGVGVIAILRPPTANHLPDVAWNVPGCPNPFDIENFRVDVDEVNDGVRASFTQW